MGTASVDPTVTHGELNAGETDTYAISGLSEKGVYSFSAVANNIVPPNPLEFNPPGTWVKVEVRVSYAYDLGANKHTVEFSVTNTSKTHAVNYAVRMGKILP